MQHPSVISYLCLWQLIMVSQYDLYLRLWRFIVVMVCGCGICDVLSYCRPEYNIELSPVQP